MTAYRESSPGALRRSISFITISLFASITKRRRGICSPVSVGIRPASAASSAAITFRKTDPAGEETADHFFGFALVYFHETLRFSVLDPFTALTNVRGEHHNWFPFPLDIQEPVPLQGSINHFDYIGAWNCDREILAVISYRALGRFHGLCESLFCIRFRAEAISASDVSPCASDLASLKESRTPSASIAGTPEASVKRTRLQNHRS